MSEELEQIMGVIQQYADNYHDTTPEGATASRKRYSLIHAVVVSCGSRGTVTHGAYGLIALNPCSYDLPLCTPVELGLGRVLGGTLLTGNGVLGAACSTTYQG